jgi:site-specific DNA-methyltransferase (adenine-specific)
MFEAGARDFGRFDLQHRDAVEFLRALPPESLDLIVTDPAYESLEKHRAKGTTTRLKVSDASSNEWFSIFPNTRFPDLFAAMYRALAPNRHAYVICDAETMFVAKPIGEAAGFKFWKPLVWDKRKIGMGYHYRARYEFVLFFEKGKRSLEDLGVPDVLAVPDVLEVERVRGGYPTEKPVPLLEILISQSTKPGEVVADPFLGSGSTGAAALQLGRRFRGCDVSPKSIELARARLEAIP